MSAPVLGVEILTENVKGSILRYQDHLESLVALCARCHGRIDTFTRAGRCKRDEAENFLLDLIDRHGEVLLGRRVYAAAEAAGIERWSLIDTRKRWGIRTWKFHGDDGWARLAVGVDRAPDRQKGRSRLSRSGLSNLYSDRRRNDVATPAERRTPRMVSGSVTHQWDNPAGTKRVAGWLWTQHLGVPVLPDYSTDGTECQCRKGSECTRPGKHPVWAGELLGPFYEDGVTPTDPWRYASREYADVREWVRLGYSLAALVVGFVAVDVEGGGKDGHASLAEWARLYGVDLADVTDTLTVRTGGGGRHYWLALPERWRWAPPVELQPCDGWLPGVDIKLATAENPNSKATLPGSAHRSGRPYTLQLPPNGNIPAPREAPERLLRAIAQGRRWEPLSQAERDALRPLTANEHLTGHLRAWRHARRFLGPAEAAPPRRSFRGVRLGSLTPAHDLRGLTS